MASAKTPPPLTDIMTALQIDELAPEEQEELLLDLGDLILRGSMARLVERMDGKTREEFTALMERNASDEEVEAFLAARVPGADAAVQEAVQDLTDDILAATAESD